MNHGPLPILALDFMGASERSPVLADLRTLSEQSAGPKAPKWEAQKSSPVRPTTAYLDRLHQTGHLLLVQHTRYRSHQARQRYVMNLLDLTAVYALLFRFVRSLTFLDHLFAFRTCQPKRSDLQCPVNDTHC